VVQTTLAAIIILGFPGQYPPFPERVPPIEPPVATTLPLPKQIVVDIETQRLTAFEAGKPVLTFNCSTGRKGWSTPKGEFPVRQKAKFNKALDKFGGSLIPYTLRLDVVMRGKRQHIGIHAYKSVPRRPASHGCIRLRLKDAQKLFDWADVGTPVKID